MLTKTFEYHLPEELIAQTPVEPRDSSKLMVIDKSQKSVNELRFSDIAGFFNSGDVLVLNNTRVIAARLPAKRAGGGKAEVFLLKELGNAQWEALVKPGSKISIGSELSLSNGVIIKVTDNTPDSGRVVEFRSAEEVRSALSEVGQVPLPPYIKEALKDPSRYQTVYASEEGSVAAPTAALHFTAELLEAIRQKGVKIVFTTLHMGLGSFRPIKAETLEAHTMPVEFVQVSAEVANVVNQARKNGHNIIACGTDVVRTLESATSANGMLEPFCATTKLFITPGYRFKIVDRFITNLHLPRSSHLVLVSAFAGIELIRQAYAFAIERKFRFYSFGDATFMY
ncbi:MAG TPA: tRNA preQ1(34) S-adenosylmethionine ribosyltransferase-isomerase QueA [Bacteroidales bacterium]|nr:tRNA preQ1(34) S-adenosylmethionine ribosyltransferase-isomerase QueA [Bacteroidales bacterium]